MVDNVVLHSKILGPKHTDTSVETIMEGIAADVRLVALNQTRIEEG